MLVPISVTGYTHIDRLFGFDAFQEMTKAHNGFLDSVED
jgi:hypothetical protein